MPIRLLAVLVVALSLAVPIPADTWRGRPIRLSPGLVEQWEAMDVIGRLWNCPWTIETVATR